MKILLYLLLLFLVPAAHSQIKYESVINGSTVTLQCGEMSKGPVIWSRERDGIREDILTIEDGGRMIKHINDTQKRYNHNRDDRSLMITRVSSSHSGLYYCNSTAVVCLTVTSGPNINQDKCNTRSEENRTDLKISRLWVALVVVGGVVLLLALASLSIKKFFSKRKEHCEMPHYDVYTSVVYTTFIKA